MPSEFDILCPTADSLASLSDHIDVACIAIQEGVAYAKSRDLKAYRLTCTVRRVADGEYRPKVDIVRTT